MDVLDILKAKYLKGCEVMDSTRVDTQAVELITRAYNYNADYHKMVDLINDRYEVPMFRQALVEYQHSILLASAGFYRQSFISLRLFLESFLSAIQFSSAEIDYIRWSNNVKDVNWNSIVDKSNGIFSANFIDAFFPELRSEGRQFCAIAEAVYRECSEYVHGNNKTNDNSAEFPIFSQSSFINWADKTSAIYSVIVFMFSCRYQNSISKKGLSDSLNEITKDVIGHLDGMQMIYAGDLQA